MPAEELGIVVANLTVEEEAEKVLNELPVHSVGWKEPPVRHQARLF